VVRKNLRPHSQRVYCLPPCNPTMDLMIEAKDKEQAVLGLRKQFGMEGGLPEKWLLVGEKMDDEREVPSEFGDRVYYEEGEEWRFKAPLKIPGKMKKALEKLDKGKDIVGDETEIKTIEDERRRILKEWEMKKRIKWGIETSIEKEGGDTSGEENDVQVAKVSRKSSTKRKRL
jgi:hypothetical protein